MPGGGSEDIIKPVDVPLVGVPVLSVRDTLKEIYFLKLFSPNLVSLYNIEKRLYLNVSLAMKFF